MLTKQMIPTLNINKLILCSAIYFSLVFNYPFLNGFIAAIVDLPSYNLMFLLAMPIVLIALMTVLLSVVSLPYVVKPVFIVLTLVSSLIFYGSINYGVVFDYGMIENAVETNTAEALSYFNLEFCIYFVLFGVVPAYLIYSVPLRRHSLIKEFFQRIKLLGVSLLVLVITGFFFYQDIAAVGRNNSHLKRFIVPSQFISSSIGYVKRHYFDSAPQFVVLDAAPIDNTPDIKEVLVLIVGETARAKNFSLNGYNKQTNEYSQAFSPVSFKNMYSCGTATAVSVPCMFSSFTRDTFERRRADQQQNLLDVLSLAGADVLWVDNNGCKAVCDRVTTITLDKSKDNPLCDGQYCQDEALLGPLQQKLTTLTRNKTVIVLHMMGSHGPTYFKRYPKTHQKFIPDCQRSDIQNCTKAELVNTYDNTINYSDFVISKVIKQLAQLPLEINKSMIYISDHGESLGESGAYLHGFPYAFSPQEQRHIPMVMWMDKQPNASKCLERLANTASYSHDNVYHSILGLLDINSTTYQDGLDIFKPCPRTLASSTMSIAKIMGSEQ